MIKKIKTVTCLFASLATLFLLNGCSIAPIATSFESARLVKPGKVQAAILYSSYSAEVTHYNYSFQNGNFNSSEDNTTFETINKNNGVKLEFGGQRTNIGIHYEYLHSPEDYGINYFSVEPKFQMKENRSAFSIPVGIYFSNSEVGQVQFTPTFLFTFSDDQYIEFILSPKAILFLNSAPMLSLSAGLGLSSDLNIWAIRPEIGYTVSTNPDATSGILHVGAGISVNFGN